MENKIRETNYISQNSAIHTLQNYNSKKSYAISTPTGSNISFSGKNTKIFGDGFWHFYKKLANYMKSPSEVVNASVDAFGTGVIATAIIPISPGKGDKEDKEKKFFQAIRQPISAILKLSFQLPATFLVWRGVDNLAYKKHIKMFQDDEIGNVLPDNKYLFNHLTDEEVAAKMAEYNKAGSALKEKHIESINNELEESGKKLEQKEFNRRLEKEKLDFIKNECVEDRRVKLIDEIVIHKDVSKIEDKELISPYVEKYVKHSLKPEAVTARDNIKNRTEAARKEANLSWYEKLGSKFGINSKNAKALREKCKKIETEERINCLKQAQPELFDTVNTAAREKWYKKVMIDKAQKRYVGKKFWISLLVNLVMTAISCSALNWIHPRIKELIDKHRHKNNQTQATNKKVEVSA